MFLKLQWIPDQSHLTYFRVFSSVFLPIFQNSSFTFTSFSVHSLPQLWTHRFKILRNFEKFGKLLPCRLENASNQNIVSRLSFPTVPKRRVSATNKWECCTLVNFLIHSEKVLDKRQFFRYRSLNKPDQYFKYKVCDSAKRICH